MIGGAVVGVAGAAALLPLMRRARLPEASLYPLRVLAAAGVIYGAATLVHGSGFWLPRGLHRRPADRRLRRPAPGRDRGLPLLARQPRRDHRVRRARTDRRLDRRALERRLGGRARARRATRPADQAGVVLVSVVVQGGLVPAVAARLGVLSTGRRIASGCRAARRSGRSRAPTFGPAGLRSASRRAAAAARPRGRASSRTRPRKRGRARRSR